MYLLSVTAVNVRCHEFAHLDCAGSVTILSGPNGSGKTSLLETVHTCALARTFVPVPDSSLIREGAMVSRLAIDARSDLGTRYHAAVELRDGQRKRITTSQVDNASAKDLIGALPVVALSPDHKSITSGGPSERRSFIDGLMAQSSKRVTELLYEHKRLLKQRNAVLAREIPSTTELDEVLLQSFIDVSATLIEKRQAFLEELWPLVQAEYASVSGSKEELRIQYQPDAVNLDDPTPIREQLQQTALRLAQVERIRERTMFGPQKDEVEFTLNGRLAREHASQGQHKSLLVALKLAEAQLMQQKRRERPIVLLDDVFSELDASRASSVLARIVHLGLQCIITTTDGDGVYRHAVDHGASDVVCITVPDDVVGDGTATMKAVA